MDRQPLLGRYQRIYSYIRRIYDNQVYHELSCLAQLLQSGPSDLQMLTNVKRLAQATGVHCTLLSPSHAEKPNLSGMALQVNHSIDSLPACQRVRVHAGVLERIEGLRQGERQTHERLHIIRMVVEDGPLKHCSYYALPEEKKKGNLLERR